MKRSGWQGDYSGFFAEPSESVQLRDVTNNPPMQVPVGPTDGKPPLTLLVQTEDLT